MTPRSEIVPDEVLETLRTLATPTLANAIDETGAGGVMLGLHAAGPGAVEHEVPGGFGLHGVLVRLGLVDAATQAYIDGRDTVYPATVGSQR